jgi:hypothetical protein
MQSRGENIVNMKREKMAVLSEEFFQQERIG